MVDRRRDLLTRPVPHGVPLNGVNGTGGGRGTATGTLTAAAQLLFSPETTSYRHVQGEGWQHEAWDFYESLGEFNYGVEWFGEALSRVRLNAAVIRRGGDEPEPLTTGPAAELAAGLCGGTDGQAQLLRSLAVQLSVPGESYFVGRDVTDDDLFAGLLMDSEPDEHGRVWTVQPVGTMRQSRRTFRDLLGRSRRGWEMQVEDTRWVRLPPEALVCRIWDRNERLPWRAMSPAKAALAIMREIDMYNRQVIATLLSRVALNGFLLIPEEATLPVNPAYEEAADPFFAELIDLMRTAIKNPGAPASAAPMPLRIPAELIDKFRHLTFATPLDQKLFDAREQAIRRLAATLNLPAEIITGMGDVNHWSSWQLSEDAIKMHISPKVEIITRCLTIGYLHPMLTALGESTRTANGERIIFWYDTSELTQRPDRSESARDLYRLKVVNATAARRENGFDEADAPSEDELETMVLIDLAVQPQTAAPALKELTGLELDMATGQPEPPVADAPPEAGGPVGDGVGDEAAPGATPRASATGSPPRGRGDSPPEPDDAVTASARRIEIVRRSHSARRRARLQSIGR